MARTRPYAIVLIFIMATIITPTPDILTLIAMGLPMCLLYESCIWIAWFMERRRSRSAVGRSRTNPERMKVRGQHFRTIWLKPDDECVVQLIDQRFLPQRFTIEEVSTVEQRETAIREMHVRGAGLIGASAGYGMYLAAIEAARLPAVAGFDQHLAGTAAQLRATRPTAVNLSWAVDRQLKNIAEGKTAEEKIALALRTARLIAEEDEEHCRMIGQHGLNLIGQIARTKVGKPINVLTHCNAGWLAFVDYGSD